VSAVLRLGLVGCGRIAAHGYAPAIAASTAIELVAVADPWPERASGIAQLASNGSRPAVHRDARALVDAGGLDAVVVACSSDAHLDAAAAAADAGLPCLVEKPPAPDHRAAARLAALRPAPWVGFNRRFAQGADLAAAVPARGRLELDLELRYRRDSWQPFTANDDALLDVGSHLVDLALFLGGGEAEVVRSRLTSSRFAIELRTARGPARLSGATDRRHLERAVARGSGFSRRSRSGGIAGAIVTQLQRRPHPLAESIARQLDAFASTARGGPAGALATAGDGARAMAVIDAARELAG
jgi:predicted dehydrogenase